MDIHCNASLTTVSPAKAAHCVDPAKPHDQPFSIAYIKTQYVNESLT